MIINDDSPLRRLPSQLDRKQTLFLDAIRYSIEMADLAHRRLQSTLLEMTLDGDKTESNHLNFVSAVLDAWSVIDAIHRLRGLLNQAPGVKKKAPGLRTFLQKTAEVEHLRNSVQHLNNQIETLVNKSLPVWGVLSWFTMRDIKSRRGHICTLMAGTMFPSKGHTMVNPVGQKLVLPIDLITLSASGTSVSLSEAMRQVERLARGIEEQLQNQIADLPRPGGDIIICAEIQFREEILTPTI
jgi:hypothetical protein